MLETSKRTRGIGKWTKTEIQNFKMDGSNLQFRLSTLKCRIRPFSDSPSGVGVMRQLQRRCVVEGIFSENPLSGIVHSNQPDAQDAGPHSPQKIGSLRKYDFVSGAG
jgi:hypothetical protein